MFNFIRFLAMTKQWVCIFVVLLFGLSVFVCTEWSKMPFSFEINNTSSLDEKRIDVEILIVRAFHVTGRSSAFQFKI